MRFSRTIAAFLFTSPLFLLGTTGNAQTATATSLMLPPLTVWAAGDLYNVDPGGITPAVRLTQDGTISNPTLSPDGARIAYRVLAPVAREALGRITTPGFILPTELPTDIYELDRATGVSRLILGQPVAPSLFVEGVADNANVYGAPAYSTDGLSLLIGQAPYPYDPVSSSALVAQYPIDTPQTGFNIAQSNVRMGESELPQIVTSPGGVAVKTVQANPEGLWSGDLFAVYPVESESYHHVFYPPERINIVLFDWARDMRGTGETWIFFYLTENGVWTVIDPIARTVTENVAPAYRVSTANAENSLRLTLGAIPTTETSVGSLFWEAFDPQSPESASIAYPGAPGGVALSPDGRQIAAVGYPEYGVVGIWSPSNTGDSVVRALPMIGLENIPVSTLFWGASEWRWNG